MRHDEKRTTAECLAWADDDHTEPCPWRYTFSGETVPGPGIRQWTSDGLSVRRAARRHANVVGHRVAVLTNITEIYDPTPNHPARKVSA